MKSRLYYRGWIAIFAIMFILPVPMHIVTGGKLDIESTENRTLARFPDLSTDLYEEFPSLLEDYFEDHMPYRNVLVKAYSQVSHDIFGESSNWQVVLGKDDWLFLGRTYGVQWYGDEYSEFKGLNQYSEKSMQLIAENLQYIQEQLKHKGIDFYLLIPPNKSEIYFQNMPDWIVRNNEENRCDRLVSFLRENTSAHVIYPKEEMLEEIKHYQLYYKYDTHWNLLGAYIAAQQIESAMGYDRLHLSDQKIAKQPLVYRESAVDDLANMLSLRGKLEGEYEYYLESYPLLDEWERTSFINDKSKYEDVILFVGDSFRGSLKPYLGQDFSRCEIVHIQDYTSELLEQLNPDVVILEYVDRNAIGIADWRLDID